MHTYGYNLMTFPIVLVFGSLLLLCVAIAAIYDPTMNVNSPLCFITAAAMGAFGVPALYHGYKREFPTVASAQ